MDENKYKYNSYPLGKVPQHLQRPELSQIKEMGYDWKDARDVIDMFEDKVAKFSGSKYAVAVDCCSHGLFLALKYYEFLGIPKETLTIPSHTYVSAPMQILNSNNKVKFENIEWTGLYQLKPYNIYDGAVRWTKNMYVGNDALQIVSFQYKKRIPIGKGGIILTDNEEAYNWLKLASYDGRDLTIPYDDKEHVKMIGYHMYMTPEDAARGIILIDNVNSTTEIHEDSGNNFSYPDVSEIFNQISKK